MKRVMFTRRLCPNFFSFAALPRALDGNVTVQVTGAITPPLTLSADELAKIRWASVKTIGDGRDNQILLADTANGKTLFGVQGRFRLVVPKDRPGAQSVRMLTALEVLQWRN